MAEICVIDYKCGGNIFSVMNSLKHVGINAYLSSDAAKIEQAEKILFPGVGSFETAMDQIKKLGLIDVIKKKAVSGIPFLGICVGMQVLFDSGTEASNGSTAGLEILAGNVDKFSSDNCPKIPHMGWNTVDFENQASPLFEGIENHSHFYFVHSYRVGSEADAQLKEKFKTSTSAKTNYGKEFISHFWNGENLYSCQFHPEKSGDNGLKVLKNFASL